MADLDTQLLNRSTLEEGEQQQAGRQLKKDKRSKQQENKQKEEGQEQQKGKGDKKEGEGKTMRQQLMDTKRKGVKGKAKEKVKKKVDQRMAMPARMYTNSALRQSWFWLLPTWSLTLIYIHIHAVMHRLMPSLFSDLGEEWVPAPVKRTTGFKGGRGLKIIEWMAVLLADILIFIFLFGVLLFLVLIAYAVTSPLEAAREIGLGALWELLN